MAKSAAVACTVVGIADIVGLAWITAGHKPTGREPKPRPVASDTMAGRDACQLGIWGESSRRVSGGGAREFERAGSQPAAGVASGAVPSGNRFGS